MCSYFDRRSRSKWIYCAGYRPLRTWLASSPFLNTCRRSVTRSSCTNTDVHPHRKNATCAYIHSEVFIGAGSHSTMDCITYVHKDCWCSIVGVISGTFFNTPHVDPAHGLLLLNLYPRHHCIVNWTSCTGETRIRTRYLTCVSCRKRREMKRVAFIWKSDVILSLR